MDFRWTLASDFSFVIYEIQPLRDSLVENQNRDHFYLSFYRKDK
jgi:hypothetical protein